MRLVLDCIDSWSLPSFVLCVSHTYPSVHCCLVDTSWERDDLLALVGDVYCIFVTFPCGVLGQVGYFKDKRWLVIERSVVNFINQKLILFITLCLNRPTASKFSSWGFISRFNSCLALQSS